MLHRVDWPLHISHKIVCVTPGHTCKVKSEVDQIRTKLIWSESNWKFAYYNFLSRGIYGSFSISIRRLLDISCTVQATFLLLIFYHSAVSGIKLSFVDKMPTGNSINCESIRLRLLTHLKKIVTSQHNRVLYSIKTLSTILDTVPIALLHTNIHTHACSHFVFLAVVSESHRRVAIASLIQYQSYHAGIAY